MKWPRVSVLLACLALAGGAEPARYEFRRVHDPDGIGKFYMGREIAQVMGHEAAGWLERPERVKEEEPAKLIKALGRTLPGRYSFSIAKQQPHEGKGYCLLFRSVSRMTRL